MTGVRRGIVVLALIAAASTAAAQEFRSGSSGSSSSRQADDRRAEPRQTDTAQRQTGAQRQTEPPRPVTQRQPEPQRQAGPVRQAGPQRQREPQPQHGTSDHWADPGPAWRPIGPAWRDLNGRSGTTQRPGENAFRPGPKTYAPGNGAYRNDGRHDDGPRRGGKRHDDVVYPSSPYAIPFYGSYFAYPIAESAPEPGTVVVSSLPDEEPHGFLRLRVLPRTADVYVDGGWAGTTDDFGGSGERMLPAGAHRVEITAPGFARLAFDVRVPANDTVTFTRELDPLDAMLTPPSAAPAEIPHKALYIVPRCYIGDRPPLVSDLPAGCTLDDVRVIP